MEILLSGLISTIKSSLRVLDMLLMISMKIVYKENHKNTSFSKTHHDYVKTAAIIPLPHWRLRTKSTMMAGTLV